MMLFAVTSRRLLALCAVVFCTNFATQQESSLWADVELTDVITSTFVRKIAHEHFKLVDRIQDVCIPSNASEECDGDVNDNDVSDDDEHQSNLIDIVSTVARVELCYAGHFCENGFNPVSPTTVSTVLRMSGASSSTSESASKITTGNFNDYLRQWWLQAKLFLETESVPSDPPTRAGCDVFFKSLTEPQATEPMENASDGEKTAYDDKMKGDVECVNKILEHAFHSHFHRIAGDDDDDGEKDWQGRTYEQYRDPLRLHCRLA